MHDLQQRVVEVNDSKLKAHKGQGKPSKIIVSSQSVVGFWIRHRFPLMMNVHADCIGCVLSYLSLE